MYGMYYLMNCHNIHILHIALSFKITVSTNTAQSTQHTLAFKNVPSICAMRTFSVRLDVPIYSLPLLYTKHCLVALITNWQKDTYNYTKKQKLKINWIVCSKYTVTPFHSSITTTTTPKWNCTENALKYSAWYFFSSIKCVDCR